MTTTDRSTLMGVFEHLLDQPDDPVIRLLVMTYEFDDQQLLNMLVQRPLSDRLDPTPAHAARIADLSPVVIYDARKTRPESALPHFLDLLPVRVGAWRCHHPKAYLVVTEQCIHLLIGSMNLTASGLFSNRESFCTFTFRSDALADLHVLEAFVALLQSEYAAFDSASLAAVLVTVRQRVGQWRAAQAMPAPGPTRLIGNGFRTAAAPMHALDQLRAMFREHFGDAPLDSLYVASPFFDKTTGAGFLVGDIESRFGTPQVLEIVTDESSLAALSQAHLGTAARRSLRLIAAGISDSERQAISAANDGAATASLVLERKLHSKVLVLGSGARRLVYVGSGNFTRKAWCGDNHELGVAWVEDGEASALWRAMVQGLRAGEADRFAELPLVPVAQALTADDDDYVEAHGYPEFVTGIELSWEGAVVRFTVRASDSQASLLDRYRVSWDRESLHFDVSADGTSATSQALDVALVRALLIGGRNLRFDLAADTSIRHFLPFRHDAAMFDRRFEFVHPTAEDWMSHCLGRDVDHRSSDPDEDVPDDPLAPPPRRPIDDREANPLIRTQRYLSDFVEVEAEFRKRADDWRRAPDPATWGPRIGQPLTTLARILERTVADPVDAAFRLGELRLFAHELHGPEVDRRELGQAILSALRRREAAALAAGRAVDGLAPYLRFVEETPQ